MTHYSEGLYEVKVRTTLIRVKHTEERLSCEPLNEDQKKTETGARKKETNKPRYWKKPLFSSSTHVVI